MCCFNECFQSNPKVKSQHKAVYKDARLQKTERRRYVVFSAQNAQYIKIFFLKTFKNSEIRVKKEREEKKKR